ncbi:hypothetical protein MJA45_03920 [Paenibacillus aurantius]|uniref:Uncharacterized protein n=1 Tax=Paenibacillus aurantius TaxID=2918900 RepID=A0AA96RGD3_9BACL|nr:hypothetical protein [Paenibacillus aurantius]WNQ12208.1 hypothetical protein MJA45_03920 [Paenibacillus aurantius]
MEYEQDSSGINSLSGFSFQIKVFVYYMLELKEGMQIEFETIEDVNVKKIKADTIDDNSESFRSTLLSKDFNHAIQVKRTTISNDVAMKILLNWILLESSSNNVTKYVLLTEDVYNNKDIIFDNKVEDVFKTIIKSNKKKNATISKVKELFKDKYEDFEKIYKAINEKYEFLSLNDIDKQIDDKCAIHFRKVANSIVYNQRLKELLQHITVEIMEAVNKKSSYSIKYSDFVKLIEDISSRLTEKVTAPLYSKFKKINQIDLTDSKVSGLREYKQLVACELPENLIKQHLTFKNYYENILMKYMETNKLSKVEDIEETTFENFENVKFRLQKESLDEPYNRLEETKKLPNSHAENEQIRYGCGIYLTREDIVDNQISWEDEQNAKSKV